MGMWYNVCNMDAKKEYVSVKIPYEYYGENLDNFLKNKPQFRSRADAVKKILRIHFKDTSEDK